MSYLRQLTQKNKRPALIFTLVVFALTISGCSSNGEEKSASAVDVGYRYWGYSQSSEDGAAWVTAMEGPATTVPKDGTVEGWNYTFFAEGIVDPSGPTGAPNFTSLCSQTPTADGKKRIGFVIEYGNSAIYPEGDTAPEASSGCVSVDVNATGLDVLKSAAKIRFDKNGLVCGLNGFPSKDCGADPIPVPDSLRKK